VLLVRVEGKCTPPWVQALPRGAHWSVSPMMPCHGFKALLHTDVQKRGRSRPRRLCCGINRGGINPAARRPSPEGRKGSSRSVRVLYSRKKTGWGGESSAIRIRFLTRSGANRGPFGVHSAQASRSARSGARATSGSSAPRHVHQALTLFCIASPTAKAWRA
jgi:hypothetical protein